jgi:hypothetical protein
MMRNRRNYVKQTLIALLIVAAAGHVAAEPLPARLRGSWRITRILPTHNVTCWGQDQAVKLVGTTLTYSEHSMHWYGGAVPLQGIVTREVSADQFYKENSGSGGYDVDLKMLGIRAESVTEVDLQHEDADITGATTEVPGDAVLLAGPNRIVISACSVYYEAVRSAIPAPSKSKPSPL